VAGFGYTDVERHRAVGGYNSVGERGNVARESEGCVTGRAPAK